MRFIILTVVVLISAATASFSQSDAMGQLEEPIVGVEHWLNGCAQLSKDTVMTVSKMDLDTDCVTSALEHCIGHRTDDVLEEICHEIVTDYLRSQNSIISISLPANPVLKGFKRISYANAIERASEIEPIECEYPLKSYECNLLDAASRWLDLRHAERLLEGERQ